MVTMDKGSKLWIVESWLLDKSADLIETALTVKLGHADRMVYIPAEETSALGATDRCSTGR